MRATPARTGLALLLALALCLLSACGSGQKEQVSDDSLKTMDFTEVAKLARGSTVRFAMFGGFSHVNAWIDGYVAPELKKRYDITVERVPMDAAVFVSKLLSEKTAGVKQGSIDLLWVNGENFKNLKEAGALFGPFADRLPNFAAYVDPASAARDFGYPVDGYEAPYGRAEFVLEYDSARTPEPPASYAALALWAAQNPGRFTYPQPPDFTGSAFIRQAFYAQTGGADQYLHGFDQQLFDAKAPKLWEYLNSIAPDLWQAGKSYPKDSAALDTLFARGEVDFSMSYHPSHAQGKILEGLYPPTVRTFVLREGAIANTHFTAIPASAPNKAGAMVVSDFLLSPEAQLSKYEPKNWGDFPAIDLNRLPKEWQDKFAAVDLGAATLPASTLAAAAVPEIPAQYLEALETGWDKNVLGK